MIKIISNYYNFKNLGDSIGCLIGNYDDETNFLIDFLDLNDHKNDLIEIEHNFKTRSFPKKSSLFQLIKFCIELRTIPKKVDLFHLSEFCTDIKEKEILCYLSSKQGFKLYDEFILKKHFGFLDLFKCFKTCKPNLSTILQCSVNFIPRYYSVIEHKIQKIDSIFINQLKIAFNVALLPKIYNRTNNQLYGIFTGKLNQLYELRNNNDLIDKMNRFSIQNKEENLYIFKRKNLMFNLSGKFKNLICVSVGTG